MRSIPSAVALPPIDLLEQTAAIAELIERGSLQLHGREVLAVELDGAGGAAEEAGAGTVVRLVLHGRKKIDERRHERIARTLHLGDDRAEVRLALAARHVHREAGRALETAVLVAQTDQRTQQNELVHAAGQARQQFADLDAGHVGGDRFELAAHFRRRVWLEIERILMGQTAGQVHHDDGALRRAGPRALFGAEQIRQRQTAEGETADLQE